MLKITDACKTFAKGTSNEHTALRNLSLNLEKGDFVTILGSNGAGKSTLFNAICGNFILDSGNIMLDGKDITFISEHKRAREIGRLFQDPMKGTAPNLTIEENLALSYSRGHHKYFGPAVGKKEKNLFKEKLAGFNMGLEDRMQTKMGLLSGGQRQVVTLLMSTIVLPKLLLLDEHTAAFDPATAKKVMDITNKIVKENNLTTLMITHNMASAMKTGNRTIMLDSGEIILDMSKEQREKMNVEDLLKMYSEKKQKQFDNDRILLG